jgi:predicted 2-oxoglutarate/Fe(II)-dependent dioxygenase YbiX
MSELTKVCILDNVFTKEECETIINYGCQGINYAITNNINITDPNIHKYKNVTLPTNEFTNSLHQRLCNYTAPLNTEHWNFELTIFTENVFCLFEGINNDYSKPHLNMKPGKNVINNKINILLALTDKSLYTGNELMVHSHYGEIPFVQGSIVAFPSYLAYTFQPIISGNNYVLSTTVQGPSFK